MTRKEFIETLQMALAGNLSSSSVNENIRYYQDYIDVQIRLGTSEEEVIESLGDPRLLAKTILEAKKREGTGSGYQEYDEVYEEGADEKEKGGFGSGIYRMPVWLFVLLAVIVVIFIIGIIGSVVSVLLPIFLPVLCVIMVVRIFQNRIR